MVTAATHDDVTPSTGERVRPAFRQVFKSPDDRLQEVRQIARDIIETPDLPLDVRQAAWTLYTVAHAGKSAEQVAAEERARGLA